MVYGRTGGAFPVCLICGNVPALLHFAKEQGIASPEVLASATTSDSEKLQTLLQDDAKRAKIEAEVFKSITEHCKKAKLVAFEFPQKIRLVKETWTPENEMLTAAMKMKRPIIAQACKDDLDVMYAGTKNASS